MTASTFKDRLTLDVDSGQWLDQSRRYMMIRPDALMGIFRALPEAARREALEALAASIHRQGGDSARAYATMGGSGDALLATIAETAPMLGWGRWTFTRTARTLDLTVDNSPFAVGFGTSETPVCHAVLGMLRAVGEMALDGHVTVVEQACAATGAPCCRFTATASADASSAPKA